MHTQAQSRHAHMYARDQNMHHAHKHVCMHVHASTLTRGPHTPVHRYTGEHNTPSMQIRTHTQAQARPHICLHAHAHIHTQVNKYAQTHKSIRHHTETRTRRYAQVCPCPHTHTSAHTQQVGVSCPLCQVNRITFKPHKPKNIFKRGADPSVFLGCR